MALLSVHDALAIILKDPVVPDEEAVPLTEAAGRVLAADLAAKVTQPPFDASAMDGYAVRGVDVGTLPATLELAGQSLAGARFHGTVGTGKAVRIFTGAPVPQGADCIVLQEDTETDGAQITVTAAASPGVHIRPRGQDFFERDVLLRKGTLLDARHVMLAATMNHPAVPVYRKPVVAILSTGDEIVPPGTELSADEIVSSVGFGIAALVAAHGGEAVILGIAPDDPEAIAALARQSAEADVLVTVGGASVGERDFVIGALEAEGLARAFAKVAMRPGKPTFYGHLGAMRVLGVPGNPVSALLCTQVFLLPLLRQMLGMPEDQWRVATHYAELGEALPQNGPREHYMRAVSSWRDDGTRVVAPLPSQDSSLVAALTQADCLIVRPAHAEALPPGAGVQIVPLPAH